MESAVLPDPPSYSLLADFNPTLFGVNGPETWQGTFDAGPPINDKLPAIGINATGADFGIGSLGWPADSIRVHPFAGDAIIAGWRSPVSGTVQINAIFSDLDPAGNDGVRWFVDNGSSTLASSRLANGTAPQSASLTVDVQIGTTIYVVVDDGGNGNDYNDSTGLSLKIYES